MVTSKAVTPCFISLGNASRRAYQTVIRAREAELVPDFDSCRLFIFDSNYMFPFFFFA